MSWKSTKTITREEAIKLITTHIENFSNEELANGLEKLGFGDNLNLPYCGYNFSVKDFISEAPFCDEF